MIWDEMRWNEMTLCMYVWKYSCTFLSLFFPLHPRVWIVHCHSLFQNCQKNGIEKSKPWQENLSSSFLEIGFLRIALGKLGRMLSFFFFMSELMWKLMLIFLSCCCESLCCEVVVVFKWSWLRLEHCRGKRRLGMTCRRGEGRRVSPDPR